ncbi:MAG: glycogen-binding domain-containing protein [Desulfoprunum sp.]|nr:glycogen-binding domain-containing protein [Desulfoprunum sp.]
MKDYLISLFIDDELDLDEKIDFVESVHLDVSLKDEAIDLLTQEKLLRSDMVTSLPAATQIIRQSSWKTIFLPAWRPLLAGCALATLAITTLFLLRSGPEPGQEIAQRFVIYRPNTGNMAIMGSFTDWNPLPMEKIGASGYWSITLRLKPGEHHYSYMLEDGLQIADPTVPFQESDDLGGENSIINISTPI